MTICNLAKRVYTFFSRFRKMKKKGFRNNERVTEATLLIKQE
jgi:hypothetical protein